jgi:phosphopantetheinyl transferase
MRHDDWSPPPPNLSLPRTAVHVWRAPATDRDAARAILRRLIAGYEGIAEGEIAFKHGPHGKPELNTETDLRFNLSHTKRIALYAFARGSEVGVDVERSRGGIDTVRMARRFIGPEEAERLERLDPAERQDAFLRAWVRYEATVKCLGTGIGGHNIQTAVATSPPWVVELDPGPSAAAAALAVADGPRALHLYDCVPGLEP